MSIGSGISLCAELKNTPGTEFSVLRLVNKTFKVWSVQQKTGCRTNIVPQVRWKVRTFEYRQVQPTRRPPQSSRLNKATRHQPFFTSTPRLACACVNLQAHDKSHHVVKSAADEWRRELHERLTDCAQHTAEHADHHRLWQLTTNSCPRARRHIDIVTPPTT